VTESPNVKERLVDRERLHQGRRLLEDREHRLAGLRVGLKPRPHDDRLGAELPRLAAAHGRAHAARLGLVAGSQDDASADDHGPSAQRRLIALLDRGVERIQVGVQNRRLR
jgi:hypothetical protein